MVTLQSITADELSAVEQRIVAVYWEAFALPPYNETEEGAQAFAQRLAQHAGYDDFRCVVAWEDTVLVGFAYGYRLRHETEWSTSLTTILGPQLALRWLSDAFELAELAVRPAAQGRGTGGRLHDAVLSGLPMRTALLTTAWVETVALHLYRVRGWLPLRAFQLNALPYVLMGLDLTRAQG